VCQKWDGWGAGIDWWCATITFCATCVWLQVDATGEQQATRGTLNSCRRDKGGKTSEAYLRLQWRENSRAPRCANANEGESSSDLCTVKRAAGCRLDCFPEVKSNAGKVLGGWYVKVYSSLAYSIKVDTKNQHQLSSNS